jgi:hypothetical protein
MTCHRRQGLPRQGERDGQGFDPLSAALCRGLSERAIAIKREGSAHRAGGPILSALALDEELVIEQAPPQDDRLPDQRLCRKFSARVS